MSRCENDGREESSRCVSNVREASRPSGVMDAFVPFSSKKVLWLESRLFGSQRF